MSRLIDADFIKEGIEYILNDSKELLTSSVVRNAMIALVDRAKTVDAVPREELNKLAKKVSDMREAQKRYFKEI